jgi:hypothetical protein
MELHSSAGCSWLATRNSMAMVVMFDLVPAFLGLFPVTMGVDNHQGEQDDSANQQHHDDGIVLPNVGHKTGEIINHSVPTYTHSRYYQKLSRRLPDNSGLPPKTFPA